MVGTPSFYQPAQDVPIPIFQFTDIAAGTGVVEYFGSVSADPAVAYILSEKEIYTAQRETQQGVGDNVYTFDLTPFNLPRNAKGTALFSCALFNTSGSGVSRIRVKIQKVSGGVPVDISSDITSEDVTGLNKAKMILLELPLTQKHFKKGDILRILVRVFTITAGTSTIGHSPNNLPGEDKITSTVITDNDIVTIMKLNMPYRIDV